MLVYVRLHSFNVAEALLNAVLKGKLPAKLENEGFACFSKVETSKPTIEAFQKAAKLRSVVSPPFPLNDKPKSVLLSSVKAIALNDAKLHLEEAKKHLLNIIT